MSYGVIAWVAVSAQLRSFHLVRRGTPAVSVLKPLCGVEAQTYECLRSFCEQDYPTFQVIFGVADPNDPVVEIAKRVRAEFPQRDVKVIIDPRQHGSSRKVSNLINMVPHASHEYLVLADSDVQVKADYLAEVVPPLLESDVGIVTCAYRGVARRGLWSTFESLFINDWFTPSVRVAAMGGSRSFAFGASIAMRREVLSSIGGFMSIVNQLADDYRLGELTRRLGLRTVLSSTIVDIAVAERSLGELIGHELRWLRTIRAVRPFAYGFLCITFTIPVALVSIWLSRGARGAIDMFMITAVARILLHLRTRQAGASAVEWLCVPFRDTLSLALWCWSFTTRRVQWRDDCFQVTRDGSAKLVARITS
ncbi:MAG: bacteriohopanetetrol glucosamine biosynthesis glycosyltransferase HpnI [Pseudomonadota bacterium]|nr:bacteriohopanetetrol glucosamine biosynthesis glycosyltransferase HpnI [Pseudomonadota bacterium]